MAKKKELAIVNESVEDIITKASTAGASVEVLERLFALRKEVKAEAAKEAFVAAISQFQEACPVITKTKTVYNKDGRTVRYQFAPIDSIVSQIKKPLKDAGISYRWETRTEGKSITATCIVTHLQGHAESSEFTVEIDASSFMTAPQQAAAALTFAKRYSLCNVLGISTGDEDDDAISSKKEKSAKGPKARIIFLLRTLGERHSTKEEVEEAVKRRTGLELIDNNLDEIVTRLEVLVSESHEN